jgi:hypothetical protein
MHYIRNESLEDENGPQPTLHKARVAFDANNPRSTRSGMALPPLQARRIGVNKRSIMQDGGSQFYPFHHIDSLQ